MGASTPNIIITPFGTDASGITVPIPVPSQLPGNPGRASFDDGFPADTTGSGGLAPRWEDFQGILYMLSAYCQALTGGQFWPYNSTWESANGGYALGAVVAMANGTGLWINTSAGNSNNPDTTGGGWTPLYGSGTTALTGLTGGTVTLTPVQAACAYITLSGTLTSNLQLIFPPWIKRWSINNTCIQGYTVTCKTASGSGVIIPGYSMPLPIIGDGTNIIGEGWQSGSFTATLGGGFSGSAPSGAIEYTVVGNRATLYAPAAIAGTSTGTTLTMTGLPNIVLPGLNGGAAYSGQAVPCTLLNAGVGELLGAAFIGGTGINFAVGILNGSSLQVSSSGFSPSGSKGIDAYWSVTYALA